MKQTISSLTVLVMMLVLSVTVTAEEPGSKTPPFIYVVVASEGEISETGSGHYVLSLEKDDIDHVMEISESPFRLANYISADKIIRTWKTGAGNFGEGITMEGTVLSENHTLPGIRISTIAKNETHMTFGFTLANGGKLDLDELDEIENVTVVNYCCHPGYGSGEWLWGK